MRSNELRALTKARLGTITELTEVYFKRAKEDAMYPHAVVSWHLIDNGDLSRHDYHIDIDVWGKGQEETVQEISDTIEDLFNNDNEPTTGILPTFFIESRQTVDDEDKTINHELIQLVAQNYVR